MKRLMLTIAMLFFMPLVHANSGQVIGPVYGLGLQDYDDDKNGGTPALTNYAWLQINTSAGSYNGDADNDTNSYSTECVEGYFIPLEFSVGTDKGKAMYSSANSAVLSGYNVVISYTENASGICEIDDLFIVSP